MTWGHICRDSPLSSIAIVTSLYSTVIVIIGGAKYIPIPVFCEEEKINLPRRLFLEEINVKNPPSLLCFLSVCSLWICVCICVSVCVCVCDHGLLIYLNNKTIKLKSRDKRNFYEFHACILNAWRSLIYAAIVISKFQKLRGLFCGTNICVLIGWPRMENKSFRLTGDGTLLY